MKVSISCSFDFRPVTIMSLLHSIDGLSNILSLAEGAGCQVYTEGCLTGIMSSYFIFSLSFITSPFGCPIFHPVTELASGWVELEFSSLLVDNLILVFLSFCVSVPHDSTSDVSVLSLYYVYVGESFLHFWVLIQTWHFVINPRFHWRISRVECENEGSHYLDSWTANPIYQLIKLC